MQRFSPATGAAATGAPLVLLFERNDAVAVPLLAQLRMAGYDVRAARIPVEVFDLLQREPVELVLIDLSNAAANRREFWVGLDTQRRSRTVHVLTFRYMATGETGELDGSLRVARADVEIQGAQGFSPLIEAVRARLPGATPIPQFSGPPANLSMPATNSPQGGWNPPTNGGPQWTPMGPASVQDILPGAPEDSSPFAQPYSSNPFKRGGNNNGNGQRPNLPPLQSDPFGHGRGGPMAPPAWNPPPTPRQPFDRGHGIVDDYASGFGAPTSNGNGNGNGYAAPRSNPPISDAWTPPEPAPRRGVAYRGYDDEPLAPDDPRIEDSTSPVPIIAYRNGSGNGAVRNDRALSTVLSDGTVMAPQRLDALRAIQQTLAAVGMDFSLGDLAMLFKFLTPDQLLAALLVSRGLVTAEEIASLGRIKQELLAAGKDYDLETLLVMFNVLPADQVRALQAELG